MTDDIFSLKNIAPMLFVEGEPFDSKDYIYELKLDGIRCLAYLDESGTELRNKRNKSVTNIYPELKNIHKQVKTRCILDGELIVTIDGKPNFFEVARRSLMTNDFKIKHLSKSKPVNFVCFDCIYSDGSQITEKPLIERKKILKKIVNENKFIAISRYIHEEGIAFYRLAVSQNLEGVVAKKINSYYYFGKRTKDWLKFKKMFDEDFVICGFVPEDNEIKSLVLGIYKCNEFIYQGHVALGISKEDQKIILDYAEKHRINCPFSKELDEEDTVWIENKLVGTVKYMMRTPNNNLRQPVFKGLRDDKSYKECIIS